MHHDQEVVNESVSKVSLVAVGDNLIHHTVYSAAYTNGIYDFTSMFEEIKPYIKQFDIAFINQETILGGKELGLSTYPAFNSPHELGDTLVDTGFNLVSIANNHTLDRGEKAIISATNYLDKLPLIYSGAARSSNGLHVKIFKKNGITFAFVAYTYGTNGIPVPSGKDYLVNLYSNQKAKADLDKVRDLVDVIIVSMHWGDEYQDYPNETQKTQAKYLANLGVDIIIGHHPHVIQPVEVIINDKGEETFVIYSLGNILSDQKGIDRLIGMAVNIDIYKTKDNSFIDIDKAQAKLIYRYKDQNGNFNIKLFSDLTNFFLEDYEHHFDRKASLIKSYYNNIKVK
jgi:poly-gamma-glutamate synthesis protein (capsule biosynthesis protein)